MTVFEKLKKAIGETMPEIDINSVTMDSSLKNDLGLDSLLTMMISIVVEEEFGFEIEDEDLREFITVGDVVKYLEERVK